MIIAILRTVSTFNLDHFHLIFRAIIVPHFMSVYLFQCVGIIVLYVQCLFIFTHVFNMFFFLPT